MSTTSAKPYTPRCLEGSHSATVSCTGFLDDDRRIISCSKDGSIQIWGTRKWKRAQTRAILSVYSWSPDEFYIASGSKGETVIIWDANTGEIVEDPVAFWSVSKGQLLRIVEVCHASQQVHCVTRTSDDRLFLGCNDGIVQTGTNTHLGERIDPICAIILPQDESLLATARDSAICLWYPKTNQSDGRPLEHAGHLSCAAFTRNSGLLATSGVDKNVYVWHLEALLGRDINVTDNELGSALDSFLAGHFFLDRGSPPSPRLWDECSTTQPATSLIRFVCKVAVARARQAFSRLRSVPRMRVVEVDYKNPLHGHQSRLPVQQESAATSVVMGTGLTSDRSHQHVRVKDNVWVRLWLLVGCLSPTDVDE
ncbi:WD40-repeat-containing domain protein [Suillus ampliporus]|nr:WD40-repeat-containing domain protein [Suillus ampliporus]